jgi:Neuraminidase (sialidase)
MVKYSDDGGKTFSEPRQMISEGMPDRGPAKNKCILLSDGSIAAPGSTEPLGVDIWDSFVDISRDGGENWEPGPFIPVRRVDKRARHFAYDPKRCCGKGLIQPTLWESKPGHIHALMRSTSAAVFRSDSTDGGKTWCCAYNTGLPNNNSGIDLVKLGGGEIVLVSNPVGWDWGARTPLALSCSGDNGKTWKEIFVLENESGEYSYPAIIAGENEILLTYTWRRERIAFWRLKFSR